MEGLEEPTPVSLLHRGWDATHDRDGPVHPANVAALPVRGRDPGGEVVDPTAQRDRDLLGAVAAGAAVAVLAAVGAFTAEGFSAVGVVAAPTGAAAMWLLAANLPVGWWVHLVAVVATTVALWQQPYGNGGLALLRFVLVTFVQLALALACLQGWWSWRRGGPDGGPVPVTRVRLRTALLTAPVVLVAVAVVSAPQAGSGLERLWPAVLGVGSVAGFAWLARRHVEGWWVLIAVHAVGVAVHAPAGRPVSAALHLVFLVLAAVGNGRFQRRRTGSEVTLGRPAVR
ncbi:nicotinamide mononucleotide transporter [Nitriliruptoraceae bacterium ZYF776]|nr:nicotinamide mononucleotide transporter [Profundirhabdus halotolerans]